MNHISDNLQLIIFHYLNSKPFLGELRDVTRWLDINSIKHPLSLWGFKPFYKSTSLKHVLKVEVSEPNLDWNLPKQVATLKSKIVWSVIYGTSKEDLINL